MRSGWPMRSSSTQAWPVRIPSPNLFGWGYHPPPPKSIVAVIAGLCKRAWSYQLRSFIFLYMYYFTKPSKIWYLYTNILKVVSVIFCDFLSIYLSSCNEDASKRVLNSDVQPCSTFNNQLDEPYREPLTWDYWLQKDAEQHCPFYIGSLSRSPHPCRPISRRCGRLWQTQSRLG